MSSDCQGCKYLRSTLKEAEAELNRCKRKAETSVAPAFPVMLDWYDRKKLSTLACPTSVPWGFIEQYRNTAKKMHGQTIERLAERGGLSPAEMMAVTNNNMAWWSEPEETAVKALKNAVAEYKMEASGHVGLMAEAERWRLSAEMACENPPDDCECPGCSLAAQRHGTGRDDQLTGKQDTHGGRR